ncbi:hypothetical protein Aph02nite_35620 [Actinoplanes philippinensis]|uniref:Uncharacterized protein n=1 Tax=Actinoplanes philippinensis TaxID=35752 RepID=A0A1I2FCB0_9ACTN|nr:hypothetical protein [Actinoplanes philippinensis]GIE77612.1 hypothetical protein Aph02nite_35620 [Actinoplanes philippinensis]SFF02407.1 hypothetical protein SAMN05421541_105253 [Actinoplanes philippinensis]
MESVLQTFLRAVPQATAVWIAVLLVLAVAVAVAALPRGVTTPPAPGAGNRLADRLESAATEAAEVAERRRAEWLAAQQAVDETWAAYEQASDDARRIGATTAYPLMSRRRKLGENVDRQRYLHRAATELCRTQDLSIAQLNDVYAHRGWNPRLHPVQQEPVLRNAVRAHRFDAYQRAVERERAAWRSAEAAAETLRGLRAEASAARLRGPVTEAGEQQVYAEHWTSAESERRTPVELPAAA